MRCACGPAIIETERQKTPVPLPRYGGLPEYGRSREMKMTVLFGSPRGTESNTGALLACVIDDDMQPIFRSVLESELVLLATPIYSWYCTAPVKAALDRLVYAMDKYYGAQGKGPSLLAGKAMAAVVTCGYRPERGADLFAEGMRRWCRHTVMTWLGALEERHMGYSTVFMDEEKAAHAAAFAGELMMRLTGASGAAAPARL